jgi:hypothetical protein
MNKTPQRAGFNSPPAVKRKLQAALYHNRQRRLERVAAGSVLSSITSFLDDSPTIPEGYTFVRNDTNAIYRDADGKWQIATANQPRFDYDANGDPLGLYKEGSRTNKCQTPNFNPVDTTGWTVSSGTATVTLVDKSTELAAAGLDDICTNGMVYKLENTGGGTADIRIDGTTGNTNLHSFGAWLMYGDSGYHGTFKTVGAATQILMQDNVGNVFNKYTFDGQVVTADSRVLGFNLVAGKTIYVILFDLQEGPFMSSIIPNDGSSTKTRAAEKLYDDEAATRRHYGAVQGSAVVRARPLADRRSGAFTSEQYIMTYGNGTGATDIRAARYLTRGKPQASIVADSVGQITQDINNGVVRGKSMPYFLSWNDRYALVGAGGDYREDNDIDNPVDISDLDIGGRRFSQDFFGHIESIALFNKQMTLPQMGAYGFTSSDKCLIAGGQSNMEGSFSQQQDNTNDGERAMVEELDVYWDTGTNNIVLNGSTAGSAALLDNDNGTNGSWYDDVTGEFQDAYIAWENAALAALAGGASIEAVLWSQGSSDAGETKARIKAAWLAIFTKMRTVIGDKPIIIQPIERRADYASSGYNNLRLAQVELAAENSWIHLSPSMSYRELSVDDIHYLATSYAAQAPLMIRKTMSVLGETVSGGVDGPEITDAVLAGDTITVTIGHDTGGTDFTPTTAIQGFYFVNGSSTNIPITAAVRTNATTITITLDSSQTDGTLYYEFGSVSYVTDETKMVRDNSTYNLPLQPAVIAV